MHRILVVDDEEDVRETVTRRLRREGYEVDEAESPTDAVQKLEAAPRAYDLVVTDMVMDDPTSGVKILEAALARDVFTEVIVLTAYGNVPNAVECMKRGAFDYVEKNIPGVDVYDILCHKIQQAMERRGMYAQVIRRYAAFAERERVDLPTQ